MVLAGVSRVSCRLIFKIVVSALIFSPLPSHSQANAANLTPEQAAQDVQVLKNTLKALHPGLTKYQTAAQMDVAFAQFVTRGNAARTTSEMYLAAAQLTAAIACGHTWASTYNMTPALRATLLESADKLPFWLALAENRWLVLASADANVRVGDEIVAINGVGAAEIIAAMLPYQRADGVMNEGSQAKRLLQLQHGRNGPSMMDVMWPIFSPPKSGKYAVRYKRKGTTEALELLLNATTVATRDATIKASSTAVAPSSSWQFKIDNNIGVLTLPTFAFWNNNFDWNKFLADTFAQLNAKDIPNLIIDIRANEGGNGAINTALLSNLLRAPYVAPPMRSVSAYERAPYQLAKHLDTWNFGFFDRTGTVEKTNEMPPRFIVKPPQNNAAGLTPNASAYKGKTYVLVGAENSSATFQLAEILKQTGAAILVGQTTAGNKRGLNSGQLAWVTLPHSGVAVDIPLLSAEPTDAQPDAGITPDILVKQTFAARAAGQDLEMAAAMTQIAQQLAGKK